MEEKGLGRASPITVETEEGHNEIVEEVVRRLAENDLYIEPEKCYKMRV